MKLIRIRSYADIFNLPIAERKDKVFLYSPKATIYFYCPCGRDLTNPIKGSLGVWPLISENPLTLGGSFRNQHGEEYCEFSIKKGGVVWCADT